MTTRCVFCDAKPTSHEHIYGKWLRKIVTGDRFVTVLETKAGRKVKRPQVGFDLTVKAVCEHCNNGWMSTLENTAKLTLVAMIRGEPCHLDVHQQRLVATWVHKTFLMLRQQAPDAEVPVPKAHYEALYRDREPPPGTLIALATQTDTRDGPISSTPSSMDHQVISASNVPEVAVGTVFYSAFLAIGAFGAIQMSNADGDVPCPFPDEALPYLTPIWPTSEPVTWPPASSDPLGQVSGLYYRMYPSPNSLPSRDESFRLINRPRGPWA